MVVAYNRKARDDMAARTAGVGGRILTLNALGYGLVAEGLGRRPEVVDEREVRRLLEPLVPTGARRLNTDPLAPYVEALTTVRLGLLRSPLFDRSDLSQLRKGYYGASIMPVAVMRELTERLPDMRLWNFYGQTEIAPLATVLKPEDQLRKPGSAGRPGSL